MKGRILENTDGRRRRRGLARHGSKTLAAARDDHEMINDQSIPVYFSLLPMLLSGLEPQGPGRLRGRMVSLDFFFSVQGVCREIRRQFFLSTINRFFFCGLRFRPELSAWKRSRSSVHRIPKSSYLCCWVDVQIHTCPALLSLLFCLSFLVTQLQETTHCQE